MKKMKSMLSLLLAIVMVFSMTLTAFADDPTTYTISISYSDEVKNKGNHVYEAYQIFIGDLSEKTETVDGEEVTTKTLSNIEWNLDNVNLLTLKDELKNTDTFGELFAENYQASYVAEVLANNKDNAEFLKAFSIAVKNNLLNNAKPFVSTYDKDAEKYIITTTSAGYYLIKDIDSSVLAENESYTAYILEVVSSIDIEAKASTVYVDKLVYEEEEEQYYDYADYDIGDTIPFMIEAHLPSNLSDYSVYKLTFYDSFNNEVFKFNEDSIEVYFNASFDSGYSELVKVSSDDYTVKYSDNDKTGNLEIIFDDILTLTDTEGNALNTADYAKGIVTVKYTSDLEKYADIGEPGNRNTVYISYSNNPNDEDSADMSTSDFATVYTYELEIYKVDENDNALTGAQFKLEKLVNGEWVESGVYMSDNSDHFMFIGLDDGTYRLTETVTPSGYNTIDPIEFKVTGEPNDQTSMYSLTVESDDAEFSADKSTGVIRTSIKNFKGTVLPSTGGMGTTVIYIAGAVLALGAVVVLITRRRVNSVK